MPHNRSMRFWDRIAKRYAARQITDVAAYEALLADVALRLNPGDRVLEIGCGTGGTAIRLASHVASYTATDFSAEMIRIARSKLAPATLHFERTDAQRAFDGAPFDAICAFNFLHLVDDFERPLSGQADRLPDDRSGPNALSSALPTSALAIWTEFLAR